MQPANNGKEKKPSNEQAMYEREILPRRKGLMAIARLDLWCHRSPNLRVNHREGQRGAFTRQGSGEMR